MFRVILICAAIGTAAFFSIIPAHAVDVYLFRGAGDFSFLHKKLHFSKGLERIEERLKSSRVYARTTRWENTGAIYREISERRPSSVAFIGHSMGAFAAMGMAKRMKNLGVRVAYVGLIDIPGPIGAVSSNVEVAENFYHAFPVYGMLTKPRGHPGVISNHYVFGQVHVTMDDSKRIQNAMVSALWLAEEKDARQMAASSDNGNDNYSGPQTNIDTTVTSSISQFGQRLKNGITGLGSNLFNR